MAVQSIHDLYDAGTGDKKSNDPAGSIWRRREFLSTALAVLAGGTLPVMPHTVFAARHDREALQNPGGLQAMQRPGIETGVLTIRQVIDLIQAEIPGAPFKGTVDTIKSGDPDQPLIVLGHSVSEEPGMQWLIPWLQPKVPGVTITHIPSGDPFETV